MLVAATSLMAATPTPTATPTATPIMATTPSQPIQGNLLNDAILMEVLFFVTAAAA